MQYQPKPYHKIEKAPGKLDLAGERAELVEQQTEMAAYRVGGDDSDFAEIWRIAQYRRADDISSDIETLKTLGLLCAAGLLLSIILALCGPPGVNVDYF
jgi:hypothetical protein